MYNEYILNVCVCVCEGGGGGGSLCGCTIIERDCWCTAITSM